MTSWAPLAGALALIAGSCLFSLNPILKFDGYWVVADALGVTNLGAQPLRLLRHLAARWRGEVTRLPPWPAGVRAALGAYAARTFGFWAWFVAGLGPLLGRQALRYAEVAPALGEQMLSGLRWPDAALAREFVTSTFMLLFPAVMLAKVARAGAISLAKLCRRPAPPT